MFVNKKFIFLVIMVFISSCIFINRKPIKVIGKDDNYYLSNEFIPLKTSIFFMFLPPEIKSLNIVMLKEGELLTQKEEEGREINIGKEKFNDSFYIGSRELFPVMNTRMFRIKNPANIPYYNRFMLKKDQNGKRLFRSGKGLDYFVKVYLSDDFFCIEDINDRGYSTLIVINEKIGEVIKIELANVNRQHIIDMISSIKFTGVKTGRQIIIDKVGPLEALDAYDKDANPNLKKTEPWIESWRKWGTIPWGTLGK